MNELKHRWLQLSLRERGLVLGCGVLVIVSLCYYALWLPWQQQASQWQRTIAREKNTVEWMLQQAPRLRLQGAQPIEETSLSLSARVAQSAAAQNMNITRMQPQGERLAVTLEPGDEVIIPAPYWVSYPDMTLACTGEPVIIQCPEIDDFKLTPAALEAAITPKTRWLILNSPTNPTGSAYTAAEFRALADVLLRHPQVLLMTDDIYEHIRFGSRENPHPVAIEPELKSRTLVINGVSKTYAMTGWRIGWAAGPADLIGALEMLQSQSVSNACSIAQAAALAALKGDQSFLNDWVAIYQQRRDLALTLINAIPGLSCRTPVGAFYLYVNCSGMIGGTTPDGKKLETDMDAVMYLLETAGVAVIAGTVYGLSPYFRMSIATSLEIIEEGCRRIAKAVTDLR